MNPVKNEFNLINFNHYLKNLLPDGVDNHEKLKESRISNKIETVLTQINKDLEAYYEKLNKKDVTWNREERELCENQLNSVKLLIEKEVTLFHESHSLYCYTVLGYDYFYKKSYGSVEKIKDDIFAKINNINKNILKTSLKPLITNFNCKARALPIDDGPLSQIISYLSARDFKNFSEVVDSSKTQENAISKAWIDRAKILNYIGKNQKEAEQYINDLGNAASYFISKNLIGDCPNTIFQDLMKCDDPYLILIETLHRFQATFETVSIYCNQKKFQLLDLYFSVQDSPANIHAKKLFLYLTKIDKSKISIDLCPPFSVNEAKIMAIYFSFAVKKKDHPMIDLMLNLHLPNKYFQEFLFDPINQDLSTIRLLLDSGFGVNGFNASLNVLMHADYKQNQGNTNWLGAKQWISIDPHTIAKIKLLVSYGARVNYAKNFAKDKGQLRFADVLEDWSKAFIDGIIISLEKLIIEKQCLTSLSQTELAKLSNAIPEIRNFLKNGPNLNLFKEIANYIIQNKESLKLQDDDLLVKAANDIMAD